MTELWWFCKERNMEMENKYAPCILAPGSLFGPFCASSDLPFTVHIRNQVNRVTGSWAVSLQNWKQK